MMNDKRRKVLIAVYAILIITLAGVSFAFFNYTRTGGTSTLQVGRIYFNSTETLIDLEDAFPTDSGHLNNTNSDTATINIVGDTEYSEGIEYKVSIVDVNNTVNGKEIPISFTITANSGLGTKSNDYWNARGSTTNVYNLVEAGKVKEDKTILVGYIKSDQVGVNGSINITAYIDQEDVAISDTVSRIDNGNLIYGETGGDWIAGREVMTTSEWNSLTGNNALSFKIKVEANEGIWVEDENANRLVLANLYGIQGWKDIRANITSIEFSDSSTIPNNSITSFDATDLTSSGPVTVYTLDDGLGNNTYKAVIAGDGVIYAPEDCTYMFAITSKLVTFDSTNFKTDNVTNMHAMFMNCRELANVSTIANWDVSNVTNMNKLFASCHAFVSLPFLSNWNTKNVTNMSGMFYTCINLENVDGLVNWNTGNVESFSQMFMQCTKLENVNGLINWNTAKVINLENVFYDCRKLSDISGLANWNTSSVISTHSLFFECYELTDFNPLAKWNTSSVEYMRFTFGMNESKSKTGNPVIDFSPIANWNVSNVTNMSYMFQNVNIASYLPFKNWNVSSVENFSNIFNQTHQRLLH